MSTTRSAHNHNSNSSREAYAATNNGKGKVISEQQLELLQNTVAQGATREELKLFLLIAHRARLDPFTRQIHFVKRGASATIQTGIDGYRAIAERSGTLAGIDDAVYDTDIEPHPNKASVTIYRMVDGTRVPFTASARWQEYIPARGQDFMWRKMPYFMLGKVAEALALRKAFPNDLSGIYIHEELQHEPVDQVGNEPDAGITPTVLPGHRVGASGVQASRITKAPSENQLYTIRKLMKQKGYTEADIVQAGFTPLHTLTRTTAGRLVEWLLTAAHTHVTTR
jgi:phage recombination protein Bet